MMRWGVLVVSLVLTACGGGGGGSDPVVKEATAQAPAYTDSVTINKQAGPNDAYSGGLSITRDASGVSGGTRGNVNAASTTHTITGINQTAFEWATLSIMDNYATAGENVALYAQGNMYGRGPTWAAVSECSDKAGLGGACVAHEFDISGWGPENNNRYAIDVALVGINGRTDMVGSTGVRVTTPAGQPGVYWRRGFETLGKFGVGLDTSTGQMPTSLRMGAGQQVAFESTDQITVAFVNGRVVFANAGRAVFEIDMNSGDTYKAGVRQ